MTTAQPSRRIADPKFRYVNAASTDVRRTFRKFRLLQRIQRAKESQA